MSKTGLCLYCSKPIMLENSVWKHVDTGFILESCCGSVHSAVPDSQVPVSYSPPLDNVKD